MPFWPQVTLDDLADTMRTLEQTEKSLEATARSRDTTQAELKAVDHRVRKLLKVNCNFIISTTLPLKITNPVLL